ncbi:MAG: hypothetical protein AMJ43_04800 [Coxiella sp. DG_40]|nr:MAG: hypothetical protein AMJ43_04800 [Coxiella sp. DG_40]
MPKSKTSEITPEHSEQDKQTQSSGPSPSLTNDVLERIARYLHHDEFVQFRAVNRQFEIVSRNVIRPYLWKKCEAFNRSVSESSVPSDKGGIPPILCDDLIRKHRFKSLIEELYQLRTENPTNPNSESVQSLLRDCHDELKYLRAEQRRLLCYLNSNRDEEMNPLIKQYSTPLLLWAGLYGYTYLFRFLLNEVKVNPDELIHVLDMGPGIISVCDSDSYQEKQALGECAYRTSVLIRILYEIKKCDPITQPKKLYKLYEVVEILLAHGADPNFMCPMHKLLPNEGELRNLTHILNASRECFKLLLKYGADVNVKETRRGNTVLRRVEKLTKANLKWYQVGYVNVYGADVRDVDYLKAIVMCANHFNKAIECLTNFSPYGSNLEESRKSDPEFFEELVTHYLTKSWPYKKLSEQGQEKLSIWYEQQSEQNQQEWEIQPQPQVEPAGFTP